MTLRSASPLRSIVALLLFFAVAFSGAADAVACDRLGSSTMQAAVSVDTAPARDNSNDQAQQHALCAHGHCHYVARLGCGESVVKEQLAADTLHFALPMDALSPGEISSVKEPPRA